MTYMCVYAYMELNIYVIKYVYKEKYMDDSNFILGFR